MDEILSVRDRHRVLSTDELMNLVESRISGMHDNQRLQEKHLSELNAKAEELKSDITILDGSLDVQQHNLWTQREKWAEASKNLHELEADKNKLLLEIHQSESLKNNLTKRKPSCRDQETLKIGRKKLGYYKELTRIRWDFGAPKDMVKGYVTDGKAHVIHTFNYEKTEKNAAKLEDDLWNEVETAAERSKQAESNHE